MVVAGEGPREGESAAGLAATALTLAARRVPGAARARTQGPLAAPCTAASGRPSTTRACWVWGLALWPRWLPHAQLPAAAVPLLCVRQGHIGCWGACIGRGAHHAHKKWLREDLVGACRQAGRQAGGQADGQARLQWDASYGCLCSPSRRDLPSHPATCAPCMHAGPPIRSRASQPASPLDRSNTPRPRPALRRTQHVYDDEAMGHTNGPVRTIKAQQHIAGGGIAECQVPADCHLRGGDGGQQGPPGRPESSSSG